MKNDLVYLVDMGQIVAVCSFLASFGLRVLSLPAGLCMCAHMCVCVRQHRDYQHHNSSSPYARITQFRPEVQNTLIKIHVVQGKLTLAFKVQFIF